MIFLATSYDPFNLLIEHRFLQLEQHNWSNTIGVTSWLWKLQMTEIDLKFGIGYIVAV